MDLELGTVDGKVQKNKNLGSNDRNYSNSGREMFLGRSFFQAPTNITGPPTPSEPLEWWAVVVLMGGLAIISGLILLLVLCLRKIRDKRIYEDTDI
jgi:hypothetical protein